MKIPVISWYLALLSMASAVAQQPHEVVIEKERHHSIVFENEKVRVLRLVLRPNEETAPHRHQNPYSFLSLRDVEIQNEVPGRAPVRNSLTAGELHTSKGGFLLAERNMSSGDAEIVVVEQMGNGGAPFDSPMASYKVHDAARAELFENEAVRAYATRIATGGRSEPHEEKFDRLIVAVTDLRLRIGRGTTGDGN